MYVIFRVKQKVKQTKITTKSHTFLDYKKLHPKGKQTYLR